MSSMRYMLTIQVPCYRPNENFTFSTKLRTNFLDYDGFVKEIEGMIISGELRRMVEGATEYHGGSDHMIKMYNEYNPLVPRRTKSDQTSSRHFSKNPFFDKRLQI